jgi:hypothetical protein
MILQQAILLNAVSALLQTVAWPSQTHIVNLRVGLLQRCCWVAARSISLILILDAID